MRDEFEEMWKLLCSRCLPPETELHVVGISKGNIIELGSLEPISTATALVKGMTQRSGGKDPLDIVIQRTHEKHQFDRVVIAFDYWRPNQLMTAEDRLLPCHMRPEVALVLRKLSESGKLDPKFKSAASALLTRYQSRSELQPRTALGDVEILFMDPMFEALFVGDEPTIRSTLVSRAAPGRQKLKDWPKFKTHEHALDKAVLDPAIESATKKRAAYSNAKSRWGLIFIKNADPDALLWKHPIAERLCRVLCS